MSLFPLLAPVQELITGDKTLFIVFRNKVVACFF